MVSILDMDQSILACYKIGTDWTFSKQVIYNAPSCFNLLGYEVLIEFWESGADTQSRAEVVLTPYGIDIDGINVLLRSGYVHTVRVHL